MLAEQRCVIYYEYSGIDMDDIMLEAADGKGFVSKIHTAIQTVIQKITGIFTKVKEEKINLEEEVEVPEKACENTSKFLSAVKKFNGFLARHSGKITLALGSILTINTLGNWKKSDEKNERKMVKKKKKVLKNLLEESRSTITDLNRSFTASVKNKDVRGAVSTLKQKREAKKINKEVKKELKEVNSNVEQAHPGILKLVQIMNSLCTLLSNFILRR